MNPRQIFMEAFRLKSQGDLSGALKLYMRVIELDPNCAGAYLNAGAILFRMNALRQVGDGLITKIG